MECTSAAKLTHLHFSDLSERSVCMAGIQPATHTEEAMDQAIRINRETQSTMEVPSWRQGSLSNTNGSRA